MNRKSRSGKSVPSGNDVPTSWCWRRWVDPKSFDLWSAKLNAIEGLIWISTERPTHRRILLAAYSEKRADALALNRNLGGQVRAVKPSEWIGTKARPAIRIGRRFQIVDESEQLPTRPVVPTLRIPHGLAFGSGEHSTTYLLLRALGNEKEMARTSVLDLGTGSGVLALAARLLGARKIVATDFDAAAVKTAAQNELLNFPDSTIVWRCADVLKLRPRPRFDLVIANLFSGILGEAAPQIASSVQPGGRLWLSGVLQSQQAEVIRAYRRAGLKLNRVSNRGKWVMIQLDRPAASK